MVRSRGAKILILSLLLAGGCGSGSGGSTGATPVTPPPDGECRESFDSAFAAIQQIVFERRGCTENVCHGSAMSGGLDLRPDAAFASLVGAPSVGSSLLRVDPTSVKNSYLFQKLAARTDPSLVTTSISGSPMPLSGEPLTSNQLEAIRLWIEAGAPESGSVGDEFGGSRMAELLGACLPEPDPVVVKPLPSPAPGTGVAMPMPAYVIPAASEAEVCFAEYIDFRDRIPDRFLTPDGDYFYANGTVDRSDPNTHHLTISYSGFGAEMVNRPEYGRWECAAGTPFEGQECDPLDPQHCGGGQCRSEIKNSVACLGFGPPGGGNGVTPGSRFNTANGRPGFFAKAQAHGIFYWNSHAFNLTTKDLVHHNYKNISFTDDLRFESVGFQQLRQIGAAAATPPFARGEYCGEHVLPRGTQLLTLLSHTHKRGERFTIDVKATGERLYDNPFWDDPIEVKFDPPRLFDSEDPGPRTLTYCGVFNNGVGPDGSPDVNKVTRLSRKPARSTCKPVACAAGRIGDACAGASDHATCDTSPGAGDGLCDACFITAGETSDDEMFVLRGTVLKLPE